VIATDITAAEVEAVVKHPTGGTDRLMKAVDMGGYNVGVGVLRRGSDEAGRAGGRHHAREDHRGAITWSRARARC
jgi:hypothetical protein